MSYKNSMKLLTSSFGLVWKQLFYCLLCTLLSIGSAYLFLRPVIDCLNNAGWIDQFVSIFETVYVNFKEIGDVVTQTFTNFFMIIKTNFSSLWFSFLCMFLISYMLPQVLINYSQFVLCKIESDQMSSLLKSGYTKTCFENVRLGLLYSLAKFIYTLPFVILELLFVYFYIKTAVTPVLTIILLPLISLVMIVIDSIRLTVFSCFAGVVMETGKNPFKGLFKSIVTLGKSFGRVFSNSIAIVLTIIAVNAFVGLFTVLAGLLITVPATMVFVAIFYDVVYFSATNKRYYLTNSLIVNPVN